MSCFALSGCSRAIILAKKFTSDHESVIFDSDSKVGIVTITNYAQSSLGDVVFVELPTVGTEVKQGGKLTSFVAEPRFTDVPQTKLVPLRA